MENILYITFVIAFELASSHYIITHKLCKGQKCSCNTFMHDGAPCHLSKIVACIILTSTMDVDASPTLLHCCCICDGPETSAQKLMKALPKGYSALLGYAEAIGNSAVLECIKEACKVESVRYHKECRLELYNNAVKVKTKSTRKYH